MTLWTAARGPELESLETLVSDLAASQRKVAPRLEPWPEGAPDRPTGRDLVELVEAARQTGGPIPALLEVPDNALPALVEAGIAWPADERFVRRLGMTFDDFLPWLTTAGLLRADEVFGLPFRIEAPLLALAPNGGAAELEGRTGSAALASLEALARAPGAEAGVRPLAAAADHRLLLALLRGRGREPFGRHEGETVLDERALRDALERLARLTGGAPLGLGAEAERAALEELASGRARAALVWSPAARGLGAEGPRLLRAPVRVRGTYLVVVAAAPWRTREAAFRVARWLTEPHQTATLAGQLGTVPVRRSAAEGATFARATRGAPWAVAALAPDEPLGLPVDGRLADLLVEVVEPALARGETPAAVTRALRDALGRREGRGRGPQGG